MGLRLSIGDETQAVPVRVVPGFPAPFRTYLKASHRVFGDSCSDFLRWRPQLRCSASPCFRSARSPFMAALWRHRRHGHFRRQPWRLRPRTSPIPQLAKKSGRPRWSSVIDQACRRHGTFHYPASFLPKDAPICCVPSAAPLSRFGTLGAGSERWTAHTSSGPFVSGSATQFDPPESRLFLNLRSSWTAKSSTTLD